MKKLIIIAHYGLNRKITETECRAVVDNCGYGETVFIEFEACSAKLDELYNLPFDNIALAQQRQFAQIVTPVLEAYPDAEIAYFGLAPIPVAFHFGYLLGNTRSVTIYQYHHVRNEWFAEALPPTQEYKFEIVPPILPLEIQRGKGVIVVRVATSFAIDQNSTYAVVENPANEFNIELRQPDVDSLHTQSNIIQVVDSFQSVLNAYANKLSDREQIHLFMACSAGLPFALGMRINPNIYPYIQTYQYARDQDPKYKEAILISRETNNQAVPTDEDRSVSGAIRNDWNNLLKTSVRPFILSITGRQGENWLHTLCENKEDYDKVCKYLKTPWSEVIDIGKTNLKDDNIDMETVDVQGGFEYIERTNTWQIDDGFLAGLKNRLEKKPLTDISQAARLFFFHESLHYANEGHRLTRETADGIGQFPKVIEDADYQADVWGLLTEYRYCQMFDTNRVEKGVKDFFCKAIDTAVETMWSFVDTGSDLEEVQIRSMNRFLNWYWQWVRIETLQGKGTLEEIVCILFDKPVIEFAGAPMTLLAHRTFYRLNTRKTSNFQLAAFYKNRVFRFAPNMISSIVDGFKQLNGEKIKEGLKSFHNNID